MVEGGHPLREKLTLFWHNHFATSYAKIRETKLMFAQNVTLRKYALGKFRFFLEMSKDPGDASVARREPEREGRTERELRS